MTAPASNEGKIENGEPDSDRELLRSYLEARSESAFATLVQRHLNLVYFAALRRTENPALAEEVAQEVFSAVAQKAAALQRHASLAGWLYTATRYAAAQKMRAEQTRQRREQDT